ncbi:MAG: hypothetical protein ACI30D_05755 [Muribaculaceae bacterium]
MTYHLIEFSLFNCIILLDFLSLGGMVYTTYSMTRGKTANRMILSTWAAVFGLSAIICSLVLVILVLGTM